MIPAELLATIPAGHTAVGASFSPDGARLYVCNRFDQNVSVIDMPAAREITRVDAVREPIATAVTPDGQTVLVANQPEKDAADIDTYLKSLTPVPSPHLVEGQLSPAAERGRELFQSQRVNCHSCHPAPLYTDLKSHNVGTRSRLEYGERFDTPTLVEVWRTAPYLHDGRYTTIQELLVDGRHGLKGGRLEELNPQEIQDLVDFVLSL